MFNQSTSPLLPVTVAIWHRKPTTEPRYNALTLHGFCAILRVNCWLLLIIFNLLNIKTMEKIITYFGQDAKVGCDEKCHKAWGINNRPNVELSDDEDDYAYLSDDELGIAPIDPGTYEGGHAKPTLKTEIPNKWCVRECERCTMSKPNQSHLPLQLKDFSKRRYNQPFKHGL